MLDMLEKLEKSHPKALQYFMDQAQKRKLYNPSPVIKKKLRLGGSVTPLSYSSPFRKIQNNSKIESMQPLSTNSSNS